MKILFTTNIPSPYRVDFFNELGKYCDLTVLFEAESAKDRDPKWKANDFVNFKAIFMKGIRVRNDQAFCPEVLKHVKAPDYDVIVIGLYSSPTGMLAIQYLRAKKKPFILSSDGGIKKMDSGITHKIKAHFISSATMWLSTGRETTEYLVYYGALREKVFQYPFTSIWRKDLIPQVISPSEKALYRQKLGISEKNVILSVGQFIYRKGYDILLQACKDLEEDTGVYIVGGMPTEEYLALKEKLNLKHVYFIDFMQKDSLAEYYKAADLFVLPTREDIWGLVINEAMSYGLPVVTTEQCVAGTELVYSGENGYLVPSEDATRLFKAINKALANKDIFAKKSLELIQNYTIEKMVQEHLEIFATMGEWTRTKK